MAMNAQTTSSRADLEFAEAALRAAQGEEFRKGTDASALGSMLVHLVNMHEAISTSPERHANVAKRLGDFAAATSKMAGRNPEAAAKLTRLTEALLTASTHVSQIAGSKPEEPAAQAESSAIPA